MGYLMEGPEGSASAKARRPELVWCVRRSARGPGGLSGALEGHRGRRSGGRRLDGALCQPLKGLQLLLKLRRGY